MQYVSQAQIIALVGGERWRDHTFITSHML